MIAFDNYQSLLRKVKDLEKEKEQSVGVLQQTLKELRKRFGVKNLAEAKELLRGLQIEEKILEKKYHAEKKRFEAKWKHLLKGD